MRTTLTLDDDIGAEIERLRDTQKLGLKEIVNRAMRLGLDFMAKARTAKRKTVKTPVISGGEILFHSVKTYDMLAHCEGEYYK